MNLDKMIANIDARLKELDEEEMTSSSSSFSSGNFAYDTDIVYIPSDIYEKLDNLIKKYIETKDKKYLSDYLNALEEENNIDIKEQLFLSVENRKVIDLIIESNVSIPWVLKKVLIKDYEIVKLLIENKCSDVFTAAYEEDLLQEIDGITLIEHLIKNDIYGKYDVNKIKNSRIIIDILVKYNKRDYLSSVSENIMFEEYEDGKLIDFLLKYDMLNKNNVDEIRNHPEICDYLVKYNKTDLLQYVDEKILTTKKDGKFILDILIEKNIKPNITNIYGTSIFEMVIERERYDLLENVSSYTLKETKPNPNMKLVEFLISHDVVPKELIREINYNRTDAIEYLGYIKKYNKLEYLKELDEDALLRKYDQEELLMETLLKNDIIPEIKRYFHSESIELLYKYGKFEEFSKCSSENLVMTLPNEKKVYEEIIERNLEIGTVTIENEEIVKKIYETKRNDLYLRIKTSALLKHYDLNNTYLDLILEESKENGKINIEHLTEDASYPYEMAEVYITYAKHNLHMYLKNLRKEDIMYEKNGVRLIDVLVEKTPQELLPKIIPSDVRQDMEVAMIIKLGGKEQKEIKFESIVAQLEDEYLNGKRRKYDQLPLTKEQEELLDKFKSIMSDGKGDERLLQSLFASYRKLLSENSIFANEIYHLINIKTRNPNFTYMKSDDGAYYSPGKKAVLMEDTNIETLNHETGHALYDMLTDRQIPEQFDIILEQLRNDPKFLESTAEYSRRFSELKALVETSVEKTYMKKYDESITDEKKHEIQEYLNTANEKQRQIYIEKGYNPETLELILDKTFTVEEYIAQDRRIKKYNMMDLILRMEYGPFISIGDFLDGIYIGRLKGEVLKDQNGKKIGRTYGHGISYYSRGSSWAFDEMMANYSEIAKSSDYEKGFEELKKYIGEDLFNLIQNYYVENILQSKKYLEIKTL